MSKHNYIFNRPRPVYTGTTVFEQPVCSTTIYVGIVNGCRQTITMQTTALYSEDNYMSMPKLGLNNQYGEHFRIIEHQTQIRKVEEYSREDQSADTLFYSLGEYGLMTDDGRKLYNVQKRYNCLKECFEYYVV